MIIARFHLLDDCADSKRRHVVYWAWAATEYVSIKTNLFI